MTWPCHVDKDSSRDKVPCDIILGLDFLAELKFTIDFEKRMIRRGQNQMEMTPHGLVTDKEAFQYLYQSTHESPVLQNLRNAKQNPRCRLFQSGLGRLRRVVKSLNN